MIEKIVNDAQSFQRTVAELKEIAPLYPSIIGFKDSKGTLWATCMVIVKEGDIKFRRHIVESITPNDKVRLEHLFERICHNAELNIKEGKYHPDFDELI